MGKTNFKFKNQEYCKPQRKESLYENWIKKLLVLSTFTVFFSFLTLKIPRILSSYKRSPVFKLNAYSSKRKPVESVHSLPLLVNLKGEKGPQLARIYVYITLSESSLKKEFLSQESKLEKNILFILSGQSVKTLNKKKNYFEKQIRSQLNAFLSKELVNGVRIQTKMLN